MALEVVKYLVWAAMGLSAIHSVTKIICTIISSRSVKSITDQTRLFR